MSFSRPYFFGCSIFSSEIEIVTTQTHIMCRLEDEWVFLKLPTWKTASIPAPIIRKWGESEEVVQHIQTLLCVSCGNKAAFMSGWVCLPFAAIPLCAPASVEPLLLSIGSLLRLGLSKRVWLNERKCNVLARISCAIPLCVCVYVCLCACVFLLQLLSVMHYPCTQEAAYYQWAVCLPVAPPARCWRSSCLAWCKTEPWDTKTCGLSANTSSSLPGTSSAKTHHHTSRHWLSWSLLSPLKSHTVGLYVLNTWMTFKNTVLLFWKCRFTAALWLTSFRIFTGTSAGNAGGRLCPLHQPVPRLRAANADGAQVSLFLHPRDHGRVPRWVTSTPSACCIQGIHHSPSPCSLPGVARSRVMSVFDLVFRDVPG